MENSKHVHLIAIGGSAMHNMAIALHRKGYLVTGSDDEMAICAIAQLSGALALLLPWLTGRQ